MTNFALKHKRLFTSEEKICLVRKFLSLTLCSKRHALTNMTGFRINILHAYYSSTTTVYIQLNIKCQFLCHITPIYFITLLLYILYKNIR